jgi:hypothetical protein
MDAPLTQGRPPATSRPICHLGGRLMRVNIMKTFTALTAILLNANTSFAGTHTIRTNRNPGASYCGSAWRPMATFGDPEDYGFQFRQNGQIFLAHFSDDFSQYSGAANKDLKAWYQALNQVPRGQRNCVCVHGDIQFSSVDQGIFTNIYDIAPSRMSCD